MVVDRSRRWLHAETGESERLHGVVASKIKKGHGPSQVIYEIRICGTNMTRDMGKHIS